MGKTQSKCGKVTVFVTALPLVAVSEDEQKRETVLVSYNDLDATLTGSIMLCFSDRVVSMTPPPCFEYDTLVCNFLPKIMEAT